MKAYHVSPVIQEVAPARQEITSQAKNVPAIEASGLTSALQSLVNIILHAISINHITTSYFTLS